jgi:hypothetical protein
LRCNKGIACFVDSIDRFKMAISYFEKFPADYSLGGPRFGCAGRTTNSAKTRDRLTKKAMESREKQSASY